MKKNKLSTFLWFFLILFSYEVTMGSTDKKFPPQSQETQPGKQYLMNPLPISVDPHYIPSKKLHGKVALVTGGDSGIGRAVCYYFALEGATVAFTYVKGQEDKDSNDALALIRKAARENDAGEPIAIPAEFRRGEEESKYVVDSVISHFGRIDVLVNNAGVQYYAKSIEEVTEEQVRTTFEINIFTYIFMAKHALKHMKEGSSIINTASVLAYIGSSTLLEYSATKGAIVTFTRSLSRQLIDRKIRVNGVAPGPIWTPLEVASLPVDEIVTFGSQAPINRAHLLNSHHHMFFLQVTRLHLTLLANFSIPMEEISSTGNSSISIKETK